MKPLTATQVKSLKYQGKGKFSPYLLGGVAGLYLYCYKSGAKKYKLLKNHAAKPLYDENGVEMIYPLHSLEQARLIALQTKQGFKTAYELSRENFANIANEFMQIRKSKVAIKTYEKDEMRLKKYIFPILKEKKITQISRLDIVEVLRFSENRCISRSQNTAETPNRVKNLLNQIFEYAINTGLVNANPTPNKISNIISGKFAIVHYNTLTKPNDIKNLIQKINESKRDLNIKNALIFSILTAQRSQNIRFLRWSDIIELDGLWVWKIKASEMKMRKPHEIALSDKALEVLKAQKKLSFNEFVFSSSHKKGSLSDNTLNKYLKDLGFGGKFTTHSTRSMFKTIVSENRHIHKISSEIDELCLAHTQKNKIISSYQRGFLLAQQKQLFDWYGEYLESLERFEVAKFD